MVSSFTLHIPVLKKHYVMRSLEKYEPTKGLNDNIFQQLDRWRCPEYRDERWWIGKEGREREEGERKNVTPRKREEEQ